jgi:hypothetical protein
MKISERIEKKKLKKQIEEHKDFRVGNSSSKLFSKATAYCLYSHLLNEAEWKKK